VTLSSYFVASKFRFRSWIEDVRFQIIMEQAPNPSSRVMLADEKDSLGMNRVKVHWQLGELEKRTFNRTLRLVGEELKAGGVAEDFSLIPPLENNNWPEGLTGTWHHMGTTRMDDSPKMGVVDRHCRVHSTNNLYVGGSSVFPTGGSNFPTITLTALAVRLSDHLKTELEKSGQKASALSR
jgi:choline dehydrogenase-like flavoprotein